MRERHGIGLAILSGLSWQGAAILTPVFAAEAIDAVGEGDRNAVYVWAAIVVVFGLLEAAAGAGRNVFAMRNRARGLAHVRDAVLQIAPWLQGASDTDAGDVLLWTGRGRASLWEQLRPL